MEKKIKLFDRKVEVFAGREESLKKLIVVELVCIVAPVSILLFALNSDLFYRKAFPKKYWYEKVKKLESEIQKDELLLQYYSFLIEKEPKEVEHTAEKLRAIGALSGMKPEAIESTVEKIIEGGLIEVERWRLILKVKKGDLEKNRELLGEARQELSKYE